MNHNTPTPELQAQCHKQADLLHELKSIYAQIDVSRLAIQGLGQSVWLNEDFVEVDLDAYPEEDDDMEGGE